MATAVMIGELELRGKAAYQPQETPLRLTRSPMSVSVDQQPQRFKITGSVREPLFIEEIDWATPGRVHRVRLDVDALVKEIFKGGTIQGHTDGGNGTHSAAQGGAVLDGGDQDQVRLDVDALVKEIFKGAGAGGTIQGHIDGGNGTHSAAQGGALLDGGDQVRLDIDAHVKELVSSNMRSNGAEGRTTDDSWVTKEIKISVVESDSHDKDKYTKVLLILLGVSGSASWSAYPVIEKAVGPAFAPLAYSFLCVLLIILAVGSFVTVKFDKAPWSMFFAKYVLLLSLVILAGLPTWVLVSMILAAST